MTESVAMILRLIIQQACLRMHTSAIGTFKRHRVIHHMTCLTFIALKRVSAIPYYPWKHSSRARSMWVTLLYPGESLCHWKLFNWRSMNILFTCKSIIWQDACVAIPARHSWLDSENIKKIPVCFPPYPTWHPWIGTRWAYRGHRDASKLTKLRRRQVYRARNNFNNPSETFVNWNLT